MLNGKGGVGKSSFAVRFVQYLKDKGIRHVDTDNDNENFTTFASCRRNAEGKLLRHELAVLIGEVSVGFADKDSAILVANPAGDGHEIDPAHDGIADEMMPEIMEPEIRHPGGLPDQAQGLSKGPGGLIGFATLWRGEQSLRIRGSPVPHLPEMLLRIPVQIDDPDLTILGSAHGANGHLTDLQVHVGPSDA